jgi:hypothetical protein
MAESDLRRSHGFDTAYGHWFRNRDLDRSATSVASNSGACYSGCLNLLKATLLSFYLVWNPINYIPPLLYVVINQYYFFVVSEDGKERKGRVVSE